MSLLSFFLVSLENTYLMFSLFAALSVDLWFELGMASAGLIFSLVILVAPHTASCFQYYVPLGNLVSIMWDLKMVYDIQRGQYINMS